MRKYMVIMSLVILAILVLAGCTQQKVNVENLPTQEITVFKSMGCGCCGIYSQYMEKEGFEVITPPVDSIDEIKAQFGVPKEVRSCHTSQIGEYFVEGHVPVEAVEKLLSEKPDIAGIALPGMPTGAPGMPGQKTGTWIIYAVNHDGSFQEFMRI